MKGYVIKTTGVATEQNPTFPKGTYSVKYIGKSGFVKDLPEYLAWGDDYWKVKRYADEKAEQYAKDADETYARYPHWKEKFEVIEIDLDAHKR